VAAGAQTNSRATHGKTIHVPRVMCSTFRRLRREAGVRCAVAQPKAPSRGHPPPRLPVARCGRPDHSVGGERKVTRRTCADPRDRLVTRLDSAGLSARDRQEPESGCRADAVGSQFRSTTAECTAKQQARRKAAHAASISELCCVPPCRSSPEYQNINEYSSCVPFESPFHLHRIINHLALWTEFF
jgi:hypothetical protein